MTTPEQFDNVLQIIATSPKSMHKACAEVHISSRDFYVYMNSSAENRNRYARAKEEQCDLIADDMQDIADDCEDSNKGRLQVDTRKWYLSKIKPKRYGDIQQIEITTEIKKVSDAMMRVLLQYVPEDKRTEATNAIITAMDFQT